MSLRQSRHASKKKEAWVGEQATNESSESNNSNNPHGSQTAATSAFRRWLVVTFGSVFLGGGSGVLDVAGGKGRLSFELLNLEGVKATVVDPRKDANYAKMVRHHARMALRRRRRKMAIEGKNDNDDGERQRGRSEGEVQEREGGEDGLKLEDIPYTLPVHICKYWEPKLWQSNPSDVGSRQRDGEEFVLWPGYESLSEKKKKKKKNDNNILDKERRQEEKLKSSWQKAYGSHHTTTTTTTEEAAPPHLRPTLAPTKAAAVCKLDANANVNVNANANVKKKGKGKGSRYRGVFFDVDLGKWCGTIQRKGASQSLGAFDVEEEAALAFDRAMRDKLGEETTHVNFCLDGSENLKRLSKDSKGKEKKKRGKTHTDEGDAMVGMGMQQDKSAKAVVGCWRCGPFGKEGCSQPPLLLRSKEKKVPSHHEDGFSGWAQHKAFQCPLAAQMSKKSGMEIHPEELKEEEGIRGVLRDCSVVVGLHPDQATGDIVDFALERGKPFAIVPCCTFKDTFKNRRLRSGERVNTYEDLVQWLVEKDETKEKIRTCVLDFPGRNVVLYSLGDAAGKET